MIGIDPALVPQRPLSGGLSIPCIGMGTFGSDTYSARQVADAVGDAIRCGYRLIDCASVYGNEAEIGAALAGAMADGAVRRDELFVITKVWNDHHGAGDVLVSLARSLRDLRLAYVDALFVHWPFPNYHAPGCDGDARNPDSRPFAAEEFLGVWRQLERMVELGLARTIGMSNMTVPKLEAVLPHVRIAPALIEMELHPSFQQRELFAYCLARGIQPVGYCPIGSPSRPERDRTAQDVADTALPEVVAIAQARGIHPAIVCLKWAVRRGQVAIPFSTKAAQYVENLRCATEDPLTDAEMASLERAERGCRLIKGQVFLWPGASDWRALWDEDGTIAR